jgi:UDP-N-acetylglucosamine:LPS N-acetylglucosamine transferase
MQIIHISGELDWEMVESSRQGLPERLSRRYRAYPYLYDEMGAALAAADLAVSRAGASVLGEYPLFGLPAILVPYPYAWRYQQVNAETLAQHGAALVIDDAKLENGLCLTVEKLFKTPENLGSMRKAMRALSAPGAATKIAAELLDLTGAKHG